MVRNGSILFKNILKSSGAVAGLYMGMVSVGGAQTVELMGLGNSQGKFGGSAGIVVPFLGNLSTGSPFVYGDAGILGGRPNGSVGLGYGIGYGDWGIRGSAGANIQKGRGDNLFIGTNLGVGVVFGGVGVNVNGYIPVGKTSQRVENSGSREVILVDKQGQPGSCDPQNPARVCELGLQTTADAREKVSAGFDVGVSYRLP
ncbi:MAG: hypothetical protein JNK86_07295, partial [Alphaproteobacteria bacterium]|nr:hypothetical protein [Alphaproteobacteria bacterium]